MKANKSSPALSILTGLDNFQSLFQLKLVFISVEYGSASYSLDVNDLKQLKMAY